LAFVSITRLRVRSWRFIPGFFVYAIRSLNQAKAAAGNLGGSLLREPDHIFWTQTVWESEAAMKAYMIAGAHGRAMRKLLEWCDEAAVAHWTQEDATAPTWKTAFEQLVRIGRRSKVNHPSEAQQRFEIREPQAGAERELRWS
jgi:heme-degrading monooxygenase HmoA